MWVVLTNCTGIPDARGEPTLRLMFDFMWLNPVVEGEQALRMEVLHWVGGTGAD